MQPRLPYPHSRKVLSQLEGTRAAADARDTRVVEQNASGTGVGECFWCWPASDGSGNGGETNLARARPGTLLLVN